MPTLYELNKQTKQLLNLLTDGEIDEQTYNDTLEGMGLLEKIENTCKVLTELNGEVAKYKAEIERLTTRENTLVKRIEWLKGQLMNCYITNGSEQIKAGTFTLSTRKSSSVTITDESKLDSKYFIEQPAKISLSAIKKDIADGVEVSGAEIVEKENLQIR